MNRKFGMLSLSKMSSNSMALPSFFPLCAMFLCEAYSFMADGYGIFNMHTISVYAVHTKGGQTQTSAQELTQRDRKTLPHQGIEPRSSDFNSDPLTNESYIPQYIY